MSKSFRQQMINPIVKNQELNIQLLNDSMITIIKSGNFNEILNFFLVNNTSTFVDQDNNSVFHLLIKLENLTEEQKIYIMNELISDPYNLSYDSFNNYNETPLHIAIKKLYIKIVKFLLEKGAKASNTNQNHQNALHIALLPNIQPCEVKLQSEPILTYDKKEEYKNRLYNEILSVIYNKRDDILQSFNNFKDFLIDYERYYNDYKESNIQLLDDKIIILETPIEISLKDLQTIIINNISDPYNNIIENNKIINDQIKKSIKDITFHYNEFSKKAINEINIEKRNLTFDINYILNNNYLTIDDNIYNLKKDTLNYIYDDIDKILNILYKNYNNKRRNINDYIDRLRNVKDIPNNTTNIKDIILNTYLEDYQNFPNSIFIRYNESSIIYKNTIINSISNMSNTILNEIYNIKIFGIDDNISSKNTLSLFIKIYGTSLYSNHPDNIRSKDIIDYYNSLVDIGEKFKGYTGHEESLLLDNLNLSNLDKNNIFELDVIKEINKILVSHIKKLNLWLALDNIQRYDIQSQKLNQPPKKDINKDNINFNDKNDIYNQFSSQILPVFLIKDKINPIIINPIFFVPNSFNELSLNIDYLDILKKRYIRWFLNNNKIKDEIKEVIKKYYKIELEANLIIIKIIDKIIINTIKTNNYLLAVKKVKQIIENIDFDNNEILKSLDLIITKTNYNQKLNKNIDKLIKFNKINNIYNNIKIIDEELITNIFDPSNENPTAIRKKYDDQIYDDQIVYYSKDYNNLDIDTIRRCLYNSTMMIEIIINNAKDIDYNKQDINGYTPIFYALQVGNYLLIEKLLKSYKFSNNLIKQVNRYNISTIKYAYLYAKDIYLNGPDFKIINILYINSLLSSKNINRNIPLDYDKIYEKILLEININFNLNIDIFNEKTEKMIDKLENIDDNFKNNLFTIIEDLRNKIIKLEEKNKKLVYSENEYAKNITDIGIISIKDLFNYYKLVIKKIIFTTEIYNFNILEDLYDKYITTKLDNIIDTFFDNNKLNLVKDYYLIKLDNYDNIDSNKTPIENFFNRLLDNLIYNGLLEPDENLYNIIKQQFNIHMIELVTRTLDYNKVILDIKHKWIVNNYYYLRTLYELIKLLLINKI